MKCNDCLSLLADYIGGEAIGADAERISAHLITCAGCTREFELCTAEQELFARYDRELEIAPAMWQAIAARTTAAGREAKANSRADLLTGWFAAPRSGYAFAGALAVSIVAVAFGLMYLRNQQPIKETVARNGNQVMPPIVPLGSDTTTASAILSSPSQSERISSIPDERIAAQRNTPKHSGDPRGRDDTGVLFADVAYSDLEERDTVEHVRQAENLLRSIRNLHSSDDESANGSEIDVSFEKAMSRRLLSENAVLLRDAEVAGKFPTKALLRDLEPFLMEIANLPDKTKASQLREIKDRAQKTEIVAALMSY